MQASKRTAFLKDLRRLLLVAALVLTGRSVLADWYVVPTGSMKPTILEGDRVFVLKAAYQVRVPFSRVRLFATGAPRRGDVVVLRNPDGGTVPFVKRLIGLPGDSVEVRDGVLHVNGAEQVAEFLPPVEGPDGLPVLVGKERLSGTPHPIRLLPDHPNSVRFWGPIVVPEGEVLVLGDNRDESRDGRYFGTRSVEDLLGRAVGVFWSWDPEWTKGPRRNRFFRPFLKEPGPATPTTRQGRTRDGFVESPAFARAGRSPRAPSGRSSARRAVGEGRRGTRARACRAAGVSRTLPEGALV